MACVIIAALSLNACGQGQRAGKHDSSASVSEHNASTQQTKLIKTGKPVFSVALIPGETKRNKFAIAVAQGEDGVLILDIKGNVLWSDPTPAKLVAYYQDNLVVFRDDNEQSVLDRYNIDDLQAPKKISSDSPSPIAATTLQRTAYSSLGPLRITGDKISIHEAEIQFDGPIAAVAATKASAPNFPGGVVTIAMVNGDLKLLPITAFTDSKQ